MNPGQIPNRSSRSPKSFIPLISLSASAQFRQNIFSLIRTTMTESRPYVPDAAPGLKKIPPYWYPYTTMAKLRWLGRELLEVVSTEFRDRSMEYYVMSHFQTLEGSVLHQRAEIRACFGCNHYQWSSRKTRHHHPEWRQDRVSPAPA